ncbi:MAG: hypothetical protein P3B98_02575 [Gemmatimonadota bacterium]|nr:hypothetical protein [Gemmatimonadota bacterium]
MRVRNAMLTVAVALVAGAAPVQAQCGGASVQTRDLCTKASDIYQFLMPQLGGALAGGAAMPGQGTTLGGFGHFAIGIRASAVQGTFPKADNISFSTTGATSTRFADNAQLIPMPTVDIGVGLFEGINVGVTKVGAVDALFGITYLPNVDGDGVSLNVESSTAFGFGARVGAIEEGILWPSVALTYVNRKLPTASIAGHGATTASGVGTAPGNFALNDLDVKATSWRIQAAKNFAILGLTGGFGGDQLENSTSISGSVSAAGTTYALANTALSQSLSRTNMFVGASINLPLLRLAAEYGQQSGGSVASLTNTFAEAADASRSYFTVGLRLKF